MPTMLAMDEQAGKRLERYVRARWDRDQGGIRGLADKAGVSTDAVHGWFRGREPSLDGLRRLADALGVRPYELLAVIDGDEPVVELDQPTREVIADLVAREIERAFAERLRRE